jgi:tetratricopeptide (TPR) repeat protein
LLARDRRTVIRESERLINTPGFEPYGRLLAGLQFARTGRPDKALPELVEAAKGEATAVEAMTVAAECYYAMGRFVEAMETALATLERDSEALDARRWLAAAYYDLGATVSAAEELEKISAQAPHDPRSERLLGLIGKDTERFGLAVEHYRESLRRDPDQPDRQEILVELAESLVKLSRFEEAQEILSESDPSATALTLAAECAQNLGQTEAAQDRLREALNLDPEHVPAHLRRGTLLLSLGRTDEAIDALREAVRLAPHSSQPHFHLSQAYGRKGEREKAARELKRMQQVQALEREFADLHETASANPNDADVRYRIGVLAAKLHKPDLARLWFRAALALDPQHAPARTALANAEKAANRP